MYLAKGHTISNVTQINRTGNAFKRIKTTPSEKRNSLVTQIFLYRCHHIHVTWFAFMLPELLYQLIENTTHRINNIFPKFKLISLK